MYTTRNINLQANQRKGLVYGHGETRRITCGLTKMAAVFRSTFLYTSRLAFPNILIVNLRKRDVLIQHKKCSNIQASQHNESVCGQMERE